MPRAILLAFLLAGCVFGGGKPAEPPAGYRPRNSPPITLKLPTSAETRQCYADLDRLGVTFTPLPDRDYGGGCMVIGSVQLNEIGVPVTGITAMRCGLARAFSAWVRNAVVPAAYQILGSPLVRVETFGTFACRNGIGSAAAAARLSGHAFANAVDVSGFDLADGRRITILDDWRSGDGKVRAFLKLVRDSACKRFGTVLSPDYNEAHRNHLHLEDDGKSFCR